VEIFGCDDIMAVWQDGIVKVGMVSEEKNDAAVMRVRNTWSAARELRKAWKSGAPGDPVRNLIGVDDIDAAYAVQDLNTAQWQADGRTLTGRKIGASSAAIQEMMGVDFPNYGMLFADMQVMEGDTIPMSDLQQPFVEAELAVVLGFDLRNPKTSIDDVAECIEYVVPAIEIIGSRIQNWDVKMPDSIADNASSSHYMIGSTPLAMDQIDIFGCETTTWKNGEIASQGNAENCLGSPLFSLIWLATEAVQRGRHLKAGELILTGAMGPIVPVAAGDDIRVEIDGFDELCVSFA
jgi:2-keto-4-pentenoate hydratase